MSLSGFPDTAGLKQTIFREKISTPDEAINRPDLHKFRGDFIPLCSRMKKTLSFICNQFFSKGTLLYGMMDNYQDIRVLCVLEMGFVKYNPVFSRKGTKAEAQI